MKYLFIFLLFATFSCYSQEKSIEILLKKDSVITTDWIKLYELPFLQQPFVKIDGLDGTKIKVRDIIHYRGYDQFGNYRQLETIDFGTRKKYLFTERKFKQDSSEKVKIYYDQLTFGLEDKSTKVNQIKYAINNQDIRKLNYRNVRNDCLQFNIEDENLKKANQIRIIQYISIGIGVVLLTDIVADYWDPNNKEFRSTNDNLKFMASGVLLVFPFTLEKTKQKRLIKALKSLK